MSEFSDFCLYNKTWWKNCTLAVSIQLYYVFIILHYAPRVYFCLLIFGYLVSAQGLVDLTQFYTGISMESPVVTSCGTGVTACILALVFILPMYYNPSWKISWKFFHYAMLNLLSGKPRSSNSWFLFCIFGKIVGINIVRSC